MTTDIKPSDLVLRNGRAEEVESIFTWCDCYAPKGSSPYSNSPTLTSATRIGSTCDGWRIHTGTERPADVRAEDRVDRACVDSLGDLHMIGEARAHSTHWGEACGLMRTAAYRVVTATAQPAPEPPQVSADEVRKVAAEMRGMQNAHSIMKTDLLLTWANRLDPRTSEPLKVGDRVRDRDAPFQDGIVLAIDEGQAWVKWGTGGREAVNLEALERIP